MSKKEILQDIYLNPRNPGGFSGQLKLKRAACEVRPDISIKDVKNFLKTQESHTLHGVVPKKYLKRRVSVRGPGHLLSSDLADMTNEARKSNSMYRYLIFIIDCFSRKLSVIPIKDKRGSTVASELDKYLSSSQYSYKLLWTDQGAEYMNSHTKKVCEKHGVKLYHVYNRRFKACYSERAIRTVKQKLFKILTHFNTNDFISYLDDVVSAYNDSPHRGLLGLTPNKVHEMKDPEEIKSLELKQFDQKLKNYGSSIKHQNSRINFSQRDILPEGTYVRLLSNVSEEQFHKSYKPIFTIEIFEIDCVVKETPVLYYLKDLAGERIKGVVYRNEIVPVSLPEYYPIEKILESKICPKTKKKIHLVKFLGWPEKFADWVRSDSLKKI